MLPMIAIFVLLGSIANCGGKKKGAAGAGAGVAANSPKKADGPSKKETKKEGDVSLEVLAGVSRARHLPACLQD